jgi:hypothetical protein
MKSFPQTGLIACRRYGSPTFHIRFPKGAEEVLAVIIHQFIGMINFFEMLLGLPISRKFIRMKFFRQLPVIVPNFQWGGFLLQLKNFARLI